MHADPHKSFFLMQANSFVDSVVRPGSDEVSTMTSHGKFLSWCLSFSVSDSLLTLCCNPFRKDDTAWHDTRATFVGLYNNYM